jgi:hypothetical protein
MENRRSFLGKAIGAAGALALGSSAFAEAKQKIDVNEWMKGVKEEDFPGVKEIIRHPVEGAEKVIAVIDQGHYNPWLAEWMIRSSERSQQEVYKIIQDLRANKHTRLRSFLMEGVVKGTEEEKLRETEVMLETALAHVHDESLSSDFIPVVPERLTFQQKLEKIEYLNTRVSGTTSWRKQNVESTYHVHTTPLALAGAGPTFAYRKMAKMYGAEDDHIYHTALGIDADKYPECYDFWANKERENHVLRQVGLSKEQIVYLICGLRHRWEESLKKYNEENEEKIALMILRSAEMVEVKKWLEEAGIK